MSGGEQPVDKEKTQKQRDPENINARCILSNHAVQPIGPILQMKRMTPEEQK